MYFLMAWRDEPPRSFKLLMAALTMSAVFGCDAAFGFFALSDFGFFAAFLGVAGAGAGVAVAVSAISTVEEKFNKTQLKTRYEI